MRLHGFIAFTGAHQVVGSLTDENDAQFRAKYTAPGLSAYDERFCEQWQKQWTFLLVDQQLRIQEVADHPALLRIHLKDT